MNDEIKDAKKAQKPGKAKASYLKRAFIRGLAGILPALLTILVLVWCFQLVRNYLGAYVNTGIEWLIKTAGVEKGVLAVNRAIAENISTHLAPADPASATLSLRSVTGIILSLVLIYIVGFFISSFLGKRIFPRIEKMFLRLPIVKAVYPYARQVTDFFLGEQAIRYERIVAVEYPRKGVYSIGFVTNEGIREVHEKTGQRMLVIFVPSSPTPITGYTIMVRPEETIPLTMSIDDALRMVITGGVILPENQRIRTGDRQILLTGSAPPPQPAQIGGDANEEG